MTRNVSSQLRLAVVDADLARASSARPAAAAQAAARVMNAVQAASSIQAAFDPTLLVEWTEHGSPFAMRWLTAMVSKRRVRTVNIAATRANVESHLQAHLKECDGLPARLKDAHLVALAIDVDGVLASGDQRARNGYQSLCHTAPPWSRVRWAAIPQEAAEFEAWCAGHGNVHTICS